MQGAPSAMPQLPSMLAALDDACCGVREDALTDSEEGCCASGRAAAWTVLALIIAVAVFMFGWKCYYIEACDASGIILWLWVGSLVFVAFMLILLSMTGSRCWCMRWYRSQPPFESGARAYPDSIALGPNGAPIIAMDRIGRDEAKKATEDAPRKTFTLDD